MYMYIIIIIIYIYIYAFNVGVYSNVAFLYLTISCTLLSYSPSTIYGVAINKSSEWDE